MPDLLKLGALELVFAAIFTVLALLGIRRLRRQRKDFFKVIQDLSLERLTSNHPPKAKDRVLERALKHLWEIARSWAEREHELAAQNVTWQRRYGQARALIELLGEFNQVMELHAVLDRLSQGLSRFFANDTVGIWLHGLQNTFELVAIAEGSLPSSLDANDSLVRQILTGAPAPVPPSWVLENSPWMAAPLLDAHGQKIGIVVVTSRRRAVYTVEDSAFLGTVLGHAGMAIQNATRYQIVDTLSRSDALTGLRNRGEFDRSLWEHALRARDTRQPLSLVLIDVDHFKQINDARGHPEGDRVLKQIAHHIAQPHGSDSSDAFRIGGDEFAILFAETEKRTAAALAESLCRRIEHQVLFDDGTHVTISTGVASLPEDGADPTTLMASADRALYRAKRDGRNRSRAA